MKKIICLLLALSMALSLTACGGSKDTDTAGEADSTVPAYETAADLLSWSWDDIEAAAKQEGELTFAVWLQEAEWNEVARLFEEEYGIHVNVMVGEKTTTMNKVLTELSGPGSIDVMFLAGETVEGLMDANALTPGILDIMQYKDQLVPGLSARKEGVSNEAGYWVPVSTSPAGLLYNANELTKDSVPQSFEELQRFITENPGKFAMCIPENGGTGQAMMESIIANMTGGLDQYLIAENGCDPALLEKWGVVWDWFNENRDKITFTTSNADSITRLNSGEVWLTTAWDFNVSESVNNGDLTINHGYYVPDFGLCYSGEVMSVVANASHPAAALLFINWMTSDAGQNAQAEYTGYLGARTDLEQDISLLTPEDRAKNTDWMAACYKTQYIKDFTTNVLS